MNYLFTRIGEGDPRAFLVLIGDIVVALGALSLLALFLQGVTGKVGEGTVLLGWMIAIGLVAAILLYAMAPSYV